jgi:hypothetical protein
MPSWAPSVPIARLGDTILSIKPGSSLNLAIMEDVSMAQLALVKDDVVVNRWALESGSLTIAGSTATIS